MTTVSTSVVVQKEDFLRPDSATMEGGRRWKDQLRGQYEAVARSDRHCDLFIRQSFPGPPGTQSLLGDQGIAGVRCVGFRNGRSANGVRQPLMHNKFLVFVRLCDIPDNQDNGDEQPEPIWRQFDSPVHLLFLIQILGCRGSGGAHQDGDQGGAADFREFLLEGTIPEQRLSSPTSYRASRPWRTTRFWRKLTHADGRCGVWSGNHWLARNRRETHWPSDPMWRSNGWMTY